MEKVFKPSLPEQIIHVYYQWTKKALCCIRYRQLNNHDFTIISNNCWGGICYEHFGIQKNSPTIGTFFLADSYLRFVSNLSHYINIEMKMITINESKDKEWLLSHGVDVNCPVGRLDDVEVVFMHYHDPLIALDKWNRRRLRINYDNLIFKFSYMNNCSQEQLVFFDELDLPGKKVMFVNERSQIRTCGVYYPGYEAQEQIENDTYFWNRYFDVAEFINSGKLLRKR